MRRYFISLLPVSALFFSPLPWLPAAPSLAASAWHFFTSDSSITIVCATSLTERPVARYLFTCLQFTLPAKLAPAVPSNIATPIASVPRLMLEPPLRLRAAWCSEPTLPAGIRGVYTNVPTARKVMVYGKCVDGRLPVHGRWTLRARPAYTEFMGLLVAVV